jgi:hypothetical protein
MQGDSEEACEKIPHVVGDVKHCGRRHVVG